MDNVASEYDRVFSDSQVFKTCHSLLRNKIVDLERLYLDNVQYLRREITEISPVQPMLSNAELEGLVCKALYLTENDLNPNLEACDHLKKKDNVTKKYESRKLKYKVVDNRKTMENECKELSKLKFSNNLYISGSLRSVNHGLFFKRKKSKKAKKIFNKWFFNNAINIQLVQNVEIYKIFHTVDLAALLRLIA